MNVKIIQRPRRGGKTYEAIRWFLANPDGIVVTGSHERAKFFIEEVRSTLVAKYGKFRGQQMFDSKDVEKRVTRLNPESLRGRPRTRVFIEDADFVLQSLVSPMELDGVTWNG